MTESMIDLCTLTGILVCLIGGIGLLIKVWIWAFKRFW